MTPLSVFSLLLLAGSSWSQTYTATYTPENAPEKTEKGQTGTNKCGNESSQTSMCQNAYINSLEDFCVWAPPEPGPGSTVGNTERIEVSWCLKSGYGTRVIPDGAIKGAHFIQTPDYVQVTGIGDFTLLNIPRGDAGGELDPHGADGNGNPIGGLVFSSAFTGGIQQIHEWTNFMSAREFCFRACNPAKKNAPRMCEHIYDVMGCAWNMPARYDAGVFESCKGDSAEPMGIYNGKKWHQGDPTTPAPHPTPSSSLCTTISTLVSGQTAEIPPPVSSSPASSAAPSGKLRSSGAVPTGAASASIKPGSSTPSAPLGSPSSSSSSSPSNDATRIKCTSMGLFAVFALFFFAGL